jgi:hypothetical protein
VAEVVALGSLIGAQIAAAGSAVVASAAAHPFLFAGGLLAAGASAYSSISAGSASREAANMSAKRALLTGQSEAERLKQLRAQNRLSYEAESTQAAINMQQRERRLRDVLSRQIALGGSGNVDVNDIDPYFMDSFNQAEQEQRLDTLGSGNRLVALNTEYANYGVDIGNARVGAAQTAAGYTSQGANAYKQGLLKGGSSLLSFAMGVNQRGVVPSKKPKPGVTGGFDSSYA